jgi:hypothetical protein
VPAFRKPTFSYSWDLDEELKALRDYPKQPGKEDRAIPAKQANRLLLATWNIANLGLQDRREKDHRLVAEILGWFNRRCGPLGARRSPCGSRDPPSPPRTQLGSRPAVRRGERDRGLSIRPGAPRHRRRRRHR